MTKKFLSLLSFVLFWIVLFCLSVQGEEITENKASESPGIASVQQVVILPDAVDDNDTLFQGYIQRLLPVRTIGYKTRMLRNTSIGKSSLTGSSLKLYDALLQKIKKVAKGEESNTTFVFTGTELEFGKYTAEELGVEALYTITEDGNYSISNETIAMLFTKDGYDDNATLAALLVDCPYDLYWFDKVYDEIYNPQPFYALYMPLLEYNSNNEMVLGISEIQITMQVAAAYQNGNSTTVNTILPERVNQAVEKINQLIVEHEGEADLTKLTAYKNEICNLVSYNFDAIDETIYTPYGDPWQLIYVFDGDENTNVVCEGYSKAFKYLCDLSEFEGNIQCILASGVMHGGTGAGEHMWNIVKMPDGTNFMADITNSDTGAVGESGFLFMSGYTRYEDGIYFYEKSTNDNTIYTVAYVYDDDTLSAYDYDAWLSMSDTDYQEIPCVVSFEANGLAGEMESDTVIQGYGYELPECGFEMGPWDRFVNWQKDDEMSRLYAPGETVIITADTVFTAIWNEELPAYGTPDFVLPEAIQIIGAEAFQGADPSVVYIPRSDPTAGSGVQIIEDYAFANCPHLWQIYIPASVTSIGEQAFEDCSDELIIYGADGSYAQEYAEQFGIPFVEYYPQ